MHKGKLTNINPFPRITTEPLMSVAAKIADNLTFADDVSDEDVKHKPILLNTLKRRVERSLTAPTSCSVGDVQKNELYSGCS